MKNYLLLALTLTILSVQGQTLRFNYAAPHEDIRGWDKFRININGVTYSPTDTLPKPIKTDKKGFDQCYVAMEGDTLRFQAKFRKGENYEISPGCCCALFNLYPLNDEGRGTVTLLNKTRRDLSLIVAEANIDTVAAGKKITLFASESAMCYFKPCSILITETTYNDSKYDYQPGKENEALDTEQTKLIKNVQWFHFLHSEKLNIDYDDATGKSTLSIDGYLTKEEYESFFGR